MADESRQDEVGNSGTISPAQAGSDIDLLNIVVQVARRKKLIFMSTLICFLIGIGLRLVWPVTYTATTKLMPPKEQPSAAALVLSQLTGGAGSLAAMGAGSALGLKNPNEIYVDLIKSRPVADAIIEKFDLQKVYRASDMTSCRKALEANTDVTSEKGDLISITVTDHDKYRVAQIANMYTVQLRALNQSLAVTEASRRALFYEGQLQQASDALSKAENSFQQVQQNKGIIQPDAQTKAMIEGIANLKAELAKKEVQVQALKSFATENNPQLEIAERELESLRAQVAGLEQHSNSSGFSNLGLADVPGAGLDYFRAQRAVLYQQTLYDILLKQYEAAKLDEAKDAAIIQVVEPAIVPDRRSAPKTLTILLASILIGLFLGVFFALISWWQETLSSNHAVSTSLFELRRALTHWK